MRVIAIIICIGLFISCKPLLHIDGVDHLAYLDFKKYSDQGFFITPEKYEGEYVPIGIFNYTFLPSAEYKEIGKEKSPDTGAFHPVMDWVFESNSVSRVMDTVYVNCKLMGANGIMNFKLDYTHKEFLDVVNPAIQSGWVVSGFAIKIPDKE